MRETDRLAAFIRKNPWEFGILVVVLTFFTLMTAGFTTWNGFPAGDITLHISYAEIYAGKGCALLAPFAFPNVNYGIPYPPLFHLFLAVFIVLGVLQQALVFLQIFLFPIVLLVSYWVVYKLSDARIATLFLLILACSGAFFDRTEQVTPQAIDFICFPLALYFFRKSKEIPFMLSVLIPVYSHSGYGLLLLAPFAIFSLLFDYNRNYVKWALILSLPIIITTIIFIPNAIHYALSESNAQNLIFKDFFLHGHFEDAFPFTYIGLTIAAFSIPAVYFSFKFMRKYTRKDAYLFVMSIIFLFTTIFMVPFFADRFVSYSAFPLSILIALFLGFVIRNNSFQPAKSLIYLMLIMLATVSWLVGIQYFLVK